VLALSLLSSLAGLVMTAGGIWLIYREKIYIDRETLKEIELELPFGMKFKTNIPALFLFVIGLVLLFYPIYSARRAQEVEQIEIAGSVDGDSFPVEVQAVVTSDNLHQPGRFALVVPRLAEGNRAYKVVYLAGGSVFEEIADLDHLRNGKIPLPTKQIQVGEVVRYRPPDSLAPVPDEFKR